MAIGLMGMALVMGQGGCASSASSQASSSQASTASHAPVAHRPTAGDLPTPPGVPRDRLMTHTGAAMAKARMSFEQVMALLPAPAPGSALRTSGTSPAESPDAAADDLSRDAQVAYIAGRIALSEGRMPQALVQLKQASLLAPGNAAIARLLAQCYLRLGNRPAATVYLQQALHDDPDDPDTLIKLGRAALQRNAWAEALVFFDRALTAIRQLEPDSPALERLCQYHLGSALEAGGYDLASSKFYLACMEARSRVSDLPAAVYQIEVLSRQFPALQQAVGDAMLRLGHPDQAVQAYEKARELAPDGLDDPQGWLRRYVYAQLLMGQTDKATAAVVQALGRSAQADQMLPLVQYLVEQGGDREALASLLERIYRQSQQHDDLAVLVSSLLPGDRAGAFLTSHLTRHPGDGKAFDALLGLVMSERPGKEGGASDGDATRLEAIDLVAGMIEQSPSQAAFLVGRLMPRLRMEGASSAARLIQSQDDAWRSRAAVRFVLVHALMDQDPAAAYRLLVALDQQQPAFMPATIMLARQLAEGEHWDKAAHVLEKARGGVWQRQADALRLDMLIRQRKHGQALTLVTNMLQVQPGNIELLIAQAQLHQRVGQGEQAQRILQDLLNEHPRDERIYEALLKLYDAGDVPDVTTQYQRLVLRLFDIMPHSRLARLQQAQLLTIRREFGQAQQILRELLKANPRDLEALGQLVTLHRQMNQPQEADGLVEAAVASHPDDRATLFFAAEYFQAVQNQDRSFALIEQALSQTAMPSERALRLALLYLRWDKPEQALAQGRLALAADPIDPGRALQVLLHTMSRKMLMEPAAADPLMTEATQWLAESLTRFPDAAADLHYGMATFHTQQSQPAQAEAQLKLALEKDPHHPEANNALGYQWAEAGVHLEKALGMIRIALKAEPDSNAYLDSLGWVYYKLGRFEEAVQWLTKAAAAPGMPSPVILDHLGDARFRAGQPAQAVETWRQAQRLLETGPAPTHPEDERLPAILREKIAAAESQGQVPVAPLGETPASSPD